jgi:transcriptional regulator with XRE-family HTH domain
MPFGETLRGLREAAGPTQEELAARASMTAKGINAPTPTPSDPSPALWTSPMTSEMRWSGRYQGEMLVLRRPP